MVPDLIGDEAQSFGARATTAGRRPSFQRAVSFSIAELIDNLQGDLQMLLKRRLRPAPSGAACATRVDGEEQELEQACISW